MYDISRLRVNLLIAFVATAVCYSVKTSKQRRHLNFTFRETSNNTTQFSMFEIWSGVCSLILLRYDPKEAQHRDRCRALVNAVMNLRVP